MKRKWIALTAALVCLIGGLSIWALWPSATPSLEHLKNRTQEEILQTANNNADAKKAVNVKYKLSDFDSGWWPYPIVKAQEHPTGSFTDMTLPTLEEMNNQFPIEVLRSITLTTNFSHQSKEVTLYYAVYSIKGGGRLFCFFHPPLGTTELYKLVFTLYVKKTLSKADFDSVDIGTSIKKVRRIASDMVVYENNLFDSTEKVPCASYSVHLLKDDLLVFFYDEDGTVTHKFSCIQAPLSEHSNQALWTHLSDLPVLPQDMP